MNRLPGGLSDAGEIRRSYRFHPADGLLEMAVLEAVQAGGGLPRIVTRTLARAVERLGDAPAEEDAVRNLSVGDRQFLVRDLGAHLGWHSPWRTFQCGRCGEDFDVRIDPRELPVKPAAPGYPHCEVELPIGRFRFRVPTGAVQERIGDEDGEDDDAALRRVIEDCLVEVVAGKWDGERILPFAERIERALEATAPEVATSVRAECPACGGANEMELDPYECLQFTPDDLLDQVHQLASAYHWSERAILALPRERRLAYLRRVDRERGVSGE